MASPQDKVVAGLLQELGVIGTGGIAVAADGTIQTQLDITVTQPAFAVLADGTMLGPELASTTVGGYSTNGTQGLWLDYQTGGSSGSGFTPVWTNAASAPTATAIQVATVTVASGVISAVTLRNAGLYGLKLGHVQSAGSPPTVAVGAGAGTSPPTPTVAAGSTDTRPTVSWGTGTSPAAGAQVTITFAQPFATTPGVSVEALNSATAALNPYISAVSATAVTIATVNAPTASQGATTYSATLIVVN